MTRKLNRREFVRATAAAAGVAAAAREDVFAQAPAIITPGKVKPAVISAANGNRYRNGGTQTAVEKAFSMITAGADVLDAVIAGVNIVELDPEDTSVGYGGLPDRKSTRLNSSHRCISYAVF